MRQHWIYDCRVNVGFSRILHDNLWAEPEDKMGCPAMDFSAVDQTLYNKLLTQASSEGAVIEGSVFKLMDCTFDVQYDAPSQVLSITCKSKPFIVSCGTILNKLTELIQLARRSI